ncbi:hypothetical protein HU200_060637 [Digitaria exilis]|uniref:Plant heme peroxidase family profile domain-containing protein n=1 Tax=Digitaria exilis TaxID=1010633 RepID=A0A835AJ24_9POAL|nr:hypothetical protein HU200_060637 [Digitaria exilis]
MVALSGIREVAPGQLPGDERRRSQRAGAAGHVDAHQLRQRLLNNLLSQKGLLHSDQELFNGGSTDNTVRNFASNPSAFSTAFATAMVKMGNISPLTGTQGQIRTTCSAAN